MSTTTLIPFLVPSQRCPSVPCCSAERRARVPRTSRVFGERKGDAGTCGFAGKGDHEWRGNSETPVESTWSEERQETTGYTERHSALTRRQDACVTLSPSFDQSSYARGPACDLRLQFRSTYFCSRGSSTSIPAHVLFCSRRISSILVANSVVVLHEGIIDCE
jgi:hypothetical protein